MEENFADVFNKFPTFKKKVRKTGVRVIGFVYENLFYT